MCHAEVLLPDLIRAFAPPFGLGAIATPFIDLSEALQYRSHTCVFWTNDSFENAKRTFSRRLRLLKLASKDRGERHLIQQVTNGDVVRAQDFFLNPQSFLQKLLGFIEF